ncbi:hypothetical protein [Candidatus Poriferisocius sp.]|uniref:hypothetical protein n=1 Tax=Candidatus Poriferisocius sp. TaxID=3101276 RepID=UPI003B591D2E
MSSTGDADSSRESAGSSRESMDRLLDTVLYAPVGLLLSVDSPPSELAARGRRHLEAARLLGRMALDHSSKPSGASVDPFDLEPG